MTNGDLEVGAEVELSPSTGWVKSPSNPMCTQGVVTDNDYVWISVEWSGGVGNCYHVSESDLILIKPAGNNDD